MTPLLSWPNWIGVVCEDLDRQRAFYADVFGLPELARGGTWAWFDLGWPNLFELLALDPAMPQYERRRFQVGFATDDITAAREELVRRGVEPVTGIESDTEGDAWCYFRDAEGSLFELSQRGKQPWQPAPGEALVRWPIWIGVAAEDFDRSRAFYRDVLGLRELRATDDWVGFDMGWPNLFEIQPFGPPYDQPGFHVAFAVEDVPAASGELVGRGAEPVSDVEGGPKLGGFWQDFRDPEGNTVGISQRLGKPWATASP